MPLPLMGRALPDYIMPDYRMTDRLGQTRCSMRWAGFQGENSLTNEFNALALVV
jgi:hypothetical protein